MICKEGEIAQPDGEIEGGMKCVPSQLIVEFRPHSPGYHGEFGFDWLRVNDIGAKVQINGKDENVYTEVPYDTIIAGDKDGPNPYLAKKTLRENSYPKLENIKIKRPGYEDDQYYIPTLSIFSQTTSKSLAATYALEGKRIPPYSATLRLIFFAQGGYQADKVVFKLPPNIQVNGHKDSYTWPVHADYALENKNKDGSQNFEVECLEDITEVVYIVVEVHYKHLKKPIVAGKLRILPNDEKHYDVVNIAGINVLTNSNNSISAPEQKNIIKAEEVNQLYYAFYQALVVPNYIEIEKSTDLRNDTNWQKPRGKFINADIQDTFYANDDAFEYLRNKFIQPSDTQNSNNGISGGISWGGQQSKSTNRSMSQTQDNSKYKDYILVFSLDLSIDNQDNPEDIFGRASQKEQAVVIGRRRNNNNNGILAHEVLHMWLAHAHYNRGHAHKEYFPNQNPDHLRFYYEIKKTDNIMSYNDKLYTTWFWQWKIVNKKLNYIRDN